MQKKIVINLLLKMGTHGSISKDISYKLSGDSIHYEEENSKNLQKSGIKDNQTDISCKDTSETVEIAKENNKFLNNKINVPPDVFVPFKFEYKEKCDNVQITGDFLDNWKKKLDMLKNKTTGFYEITIKLPRTINQFKFIVNNKWVCSKDYEITKDCYNNTNNIIDLTYFIPTIELQNYEKNAIGNNNIDSNKKIVSKKEKQKNSISNDFGCNYPNLNELNTQAPSISLNYKFPFDINYHSNQKNLKYSQKEYLITDDKKLFIENSDFKTIDTFRHEQLLHICSNCGEDNKDTDYLKPAITYRFKHKFLTIVYFQPKSL